MLIDTTAVFRDYYWKDLTTVYKGKYGDIVNDLKGDLSGKYEDAVLRFWGLVWFWTNELKIYLVQFIYLNLFSFILPK